MYQLTWSQLGATFLKMYIMTVIGFCYYNRKELTLKTFGNILLGSIMIAVIATGFIYLPDTMRRWADM